jgi:hypothetical protein
MENGGTFAPFWIVLAASPRAVISGFLYVIEVLFTPSEFLWSDSLLIVSIRPIALLVQVIGREQYAEMTRGIDLSEHGYLGAVLDHSDCFTENIDFGFFVRHERPSF